jgi:hypothetical protein
MGPLRTVCSRREAEFLDAKGITHGFHGARFEVTVAAGQVNNEVCTDLRVATGGVTSLMRRIRVPSCPLIISPISFFAALLLHGVRCEAEERPNRGFFPRWASTAVVNGNPIVSTK